MTKKKIPPLPFTIEFEEGWADELLDDDMTQEEIDALMEGIMELVESGEIFDQATPFEDLDEEEQIEIEKLFRHKPKHTRH